MARRTKIAFDLSTSEQAIMLKLNKVEAKAAKLQKRLDDVGKAGKKSFKGVQRSVKDVAGALVGPVSLAGAATVAANAIRETFESVRLEQEKTLEVIERTGKARVFSLLNTLAVFGSKEKMEATALEVSRESGATPERAFQLLGIGVTAGGTTGPGGTLKSAAKLAAFFDRFGIEGDTLIEGIITLQKTINEADAQVAFGFLQQFGTASKVVKPESQLNLIKPINALIQQGLTPELAAEFTAVVNQLLKTDPEGRVTGTGIINLAEALSLKKIIPSEERDPKTGRKKRVFRKLKARNFLARISEAQAAFEKASPEERDEMVGAIGGRAAFKTVIRDILSNSAAFQREMAKAAGIIKAPGPQTAALAKQTIEAARGGPVGGTIEAGARGFAAIERARFERPGIAAGKQALKLEDETREAFASGLEKFLFAILPFTGVRSLATPRNQAVGALMRTQQTFGIDPTLPQERQNQIIETLSVDQKEIITQLKELVRIASQSQDNNQTAAAQTE